MDPLNGIVALTSSQLELIVLYLDSDLHSSEHFAILVQSKVHRISDTAHTIALVNFKISCGKCVRLSMSFNKPFVNGMHKQIRRIRVNEKYHRNIVFGLFEN